MTNSITLSIGSNSDNRDEQVAKCLEWLASILDNCRHSSVYTTAALNGKSGDYANAVACGECRGDIDAANRIFKAYEIENGRDTAARALGIVPIDIDIVIWNGTVVRGKDYAQEYFRQGWKQLCD